MGKSGRQLPTPEERQVTSQEEQMLNSLVERVNAAKLTEKDPDAEGLLQRGFSSNPDAVYVLAQTVLVQNIALEQAHGQLTESQKRVVELQQKVEQLQTQQSSHSGSFLGSLLGHKDPPPPPAPPQQQYQQAPQQPAYQPVYTPQAAPGYQAPYNPAPQYPAAQYAPIPPNEPSFLRSAAATAAGVAAGALLFEGVEDMLHGGYYRPGFGYGYGYPAYGVGYGGWGVSGIGFGPEVIVEQPIIEQPIVEQPIQETVVENNYYDSGNGQNFQNSGQDANWIDDSGSNFDSGSDSGSFDSGGFDSGSGGDSGGF